MDSEGFIPDSDPILYMLFKHTSKLLLKKHSTGITLNSIKKKNVPTISHFLFHTAVRQCISPEFTGLKVENKIWIYLLIYSCQIRNNNSESGLRKKFWIHNTGSSSVAEPNLWFIFGSGSTSVHISAPAPTAAIPVLVYCHVKLFYNNSTTRNMYSINEGFSSS